MFLSNHMQRKHLYAHMHLYVCVYINKYTKG